jgi:hypothetical protein
MAKPRGAKWQPGGGTWRPHPPPDNAPPHPGSIVGRRRPSANRTMTSRQAAHRLWPELVGEDPADDKKPAQTPNERMSELLRNSRHKPINTDKDPLQ